jgi:predicted DNA-binding protein (UPF0278 family)
MDWDKKIYPIDIWNWLKSLIPKRNEIHIPSQILDDYERKLKEVEERKLKEFEVVKESVQKRLNKELRYVDLDEIYGVLEQKHGIFDTRKEYPYTINKTGKLLK